RSYVDAWLGPVLEAAGAGVTQAPVYYDYQLLAEGNPTPASRVRLAFFGSDDGLALLVRDPPPDEPALSGNFDLHTGFQRLQLLYHHDLTDRDTVDAVAALGHDHWDTELGALHLRVGLNTLSARLEHARRLTKEAILNAGVDVVSG